MRTAPKAGHMTAADQIVTASKKSLDPRAPSTHKHLGVLINPVFNVSLRIAAYDPRICPSITPSGE